MTWRGVGSVNVALASCVFLVAGCGGGTEEHRDGSADTVADSGRAFTDSPFETQIGGATLAFPTDHKLHAGPVFETPNTQEWFYWTGVSTDPDNGNRVAFFFNLFRSYDKDTREYTHYYPISVIESPRQGDGANRTATLTLDALSAQAGHDDERDDDYVKYSGDGFSVTYWVKSDEWHAVTDNRESGDKRVALDLTMRPQAPGYVPESETGVAYQGVPPPNVAFDPTTLTCLSYYYSAPRLQIDGEVTSNGRTFAIRNADGWFDHQWGAFQQNCNAYLYNWLSLRFEDGSRMMIRDWHNSANESVPRARRMAYFRPGEPPRYWTGNEAFTLRATRTYQSSLPPKNTYGLDYELKTPVGNYRIETWFQDQEQHGGQLTWRGHRHRVRRTIAGELARPREPPATRRRPLHLRSAFPLAETWKFDKPSFSSRTGTSVHQARVTAQFVQGRG
jgi:predicted secreted hydrolase